MRLPSSGNWKVERGMIKITKITNTKLAISLAWIVWQKVVMHPNFQLNLCKHLNLACQYSFVLIKGKQFWTQGSMKSYLISFHFFLHIVLRSFISVQHPCKDVIEMKRNNSAICKYFLKYLNNPCYYPAHSLVRNDSYCQRINKNLILRIKNDF